MKEHPKTFFKKNRKALKVRIHKDLLKLKTGSQIPEKDLRGFLGQYTSQNDYLQSLADDTHRIDLEGNEVKEVSEGDKSFLKWRAQKSKEVSKSKKKQDKEEKV